MQEMAELSKIQAQQPDPTPQAVSFPLKDETTGGKTEIITVQVGPAQFGEVLKGTYRLFMILMYFECTFFFSGDKIIKSRAVKFAPFNGCSDLDEQQRPILAKGIIAIIERGDCMFVDKVRKSFLSGNILSLHYKF